MPAKPETTSTLAIFALLLMLLGGMLLSAMACFVLLAVAGILILLSLRTGNGRFRIVILMALPLDLALLAQHWEPACEELQAYRLHAARR